MTAARPVSTDGDADEVVDGADEVAHDASMSAATGWRRVLAGPVPAYAVAVLGALIAVNTWFRPGTFVATGDMGPFIRQSWAAELPSSWSHAITGAGSATYVVARWFEFLLSGAVHALGGGDTLAQRLFYCVIYPLVAFSVAATAAVFTRNRVAIAAAGLFGVFNGFFLTRLPNPLNVISVGVCALAAAIVLRVAAGRRMPAPLLGLALLPMSFLAYNPPMLTVGLAWVAAGLPLLSLLIFGRRAFLRVLRYGLLAAPWALAINVFWLVPFAQAFTGGGGASATAQTDPTAWAWSQANNSIPNVLTLSANWAWFKPQYLPFTPQLDQPWWLWLRYLLPVALFLAPVLARPARRRAAVTLLGLVLVFTLLGKGLQPPLSDLNSFLYAKVPGFWLFREPMSKLGQLLVLFGGLLLALLVDGVAARLPSIDVRWRSLARTSAVLAVGAILVWPYPLFTGAVIPDERPSQPSAHVTVPAFWRQAAATIDADARPGKVLVLPLDDYYQMPTTWGFSGVDSISGLLVRHPVLQRHPDGYFGDTPGTAAQIDAVEQALLAGDLASVPSLLSSLGVSTVIVRHDLITGMPGRTFADGTVLAAAVARLPGSTRVVEGPLDIWRLADSGATVSTASAPLTVPGDPAALAATVAMTPAGQAVVGDPTTPKPVAAPLERPAGAATAADGVWWPVEAVDQGTPSTTFTTNGGSYTVGQVARAAATLVPREVADPTATSGAALELQDPATVLLDGQAVSQRPPGRVALDRPGVVAVQAGNHTTSLDGWLAPALPSGSSAGSGAAATVPVGAATALTAWARSTEQPTLTAATPVYDCNNYEPRPMAELGLAATAFISDGQDAVRLTARDHAACVARDVVGVTGGQTVRIRLEYRSVEGKRPQVCVLETKTQRCLPDRRLQLDDGWVRHEVIATLPPDAEGLRVVLHADVGLRLEPATTTEYRGLTAERLDAVARTEVWPEAVPETTVSLAAGTHRLEVVGGPSGSVLARFEDLDDCFRYDDQTMEQAGIASTPLEGEDGPAFELRARDHMACRGATAPDFGAAGLYTLRYGYKSVALRKPKVCLYERGPDACVTLPANGSETEWATYSMPVRPRAAAQETRLYLYGMRDLTGEAQAVVQYRDVALTPAPTSSAIVVRRAVTAPATAPVTWTATAPAAFTVHADGVTDGTVIGVAETYAPGWTLSGLPAGAHATHIVLDGWKNGWTIEGVSGPVDLRVRYAPADLSRRALQVSFVAVPAALLALVAGAALRRRRAHRLLLAPGEGPVPASADGAQPSNRSHEWEGVPGAADSGPRGGQRIGRAARRGGRRGITFLRSWASRGPASRRKNEGEGR